MISLFEVALEELEANFHIPPVSTHRPFRLADGFHLQPRKGWGERRRLFLKRTANVYAFSRGLRRGKTAASGLEFTGNNTGARARRLEPSRREYTWRDKVSPGVATPPPLSQLLNCQSQPEVSGACMSSPSSSRLGASCRDASTRDVYVAAAADKAPELLGAHSAFVWNFTWISTWT